MMISTPITPLFYCVLAKACRNETLNRVGNEVENKFFHTNIYVKFTNGIEIEVNIVFRILIYA
jgi:hypothetical protein